MLNQKEKKKKEGKQFYTVLTEVKEKVQVHTFKDGSGCMWGLKPFLLSLSEKQKKLQLYAVFVWLHFAKGLGKLVHYIVVLLYRGSFLYFLQGNRPLLWPHNKPFFTS